MVEVNSAKRLAALALVSPKEFRAAVKDAYTKNGAHLGRAARSLGVHLTTLVRWVRSYGLGAELEAIRDRARAEGWMHDMFSRGGRPRGACDKKQRKRQEAR